MKHFPIRARHVVLLWGALSASASAQLIAQPQQAARVAETSVALVPPAGYVIGPEDVLSVVFWHEKDLSADVVVRPDGKISLPVLKDLQAAGLTPEQLGAAVEKAGGRFVRNADATVIVKEIRSRKVFVVGEVAKPGTVPLMSEMSVLQLIAAVGGFLETADKGDVVIVRKENGRESRFKFNYNDVVKGKHTEQNILLQPGDTVLVH